MDAAISEDAQGIGLSSYQGGHVEYFKYMVELLEKAGRSDIKVFGGGGGVIVPAEIEDLHAAGVARIFSPDDGRALGLEGMIGQMIDACDWNPADQHQDAIDSLQAYLESNEPLSMAMLGRLLTLVESDDHQRQNVLSRLPSDPPKVVPVVGLTGTGGSGKSSLVDELCRRFMTQMPGRRVAVISVDPSRRRTGGAL